MSLAVSPISFKSDTNLIAGALKPQDSETTDKAPKADENLSQAKAPLEKDVYQHDEEIQVWQYFYAWNICRRDYRQDVRLTSSLLCETCRSVVQGTYV